MHAVRILLTRTASIHSVQQITGPLWPFFVASAITFYGVTKAQNALIQCALLGAVYAFRPLIV